MKTYDLVIIGAGSVGVPVAMEAARQGLKTLVLDKRASSGQGDNKRAIGGVRATHSDPAKIRICLRSIKTFAEWEEREGDYLGFVRGGYLFPVFREEDEKTLGWACSGRFRGKAAYDTSVEVSVYLDPTALGQGLGGLLYRVLFEGLRETDLHRAIGIITLPNPASIALHRSFGFESIGVLHEAKALIDRDVVDARRQLELG